MVRSIATVVIISILLQTFSKAIVYVQYEANRDYVAKVLCENKAKPQMHCNGRCHLMKELKKAEKQENGTSNNGKEKYEIQFFSQTKANIQFYSLDHIVAHNSCYLALFTIPHLQAVFHPPTC